MRKSSPLSLSLSLSVRARKTHLLWTKERNFKRKERERGKRERESFCVPFSFRREKEKERKNFDFEISRFSSICTHSRFEYARVSHQQKQRPLAFPGNAFVCLQPPREKECLQATKNETCGETRTKITSSLASTISSLERNYSTRRKSLKKLTNRTRKIERPLGKPGSRSCPRNTILRIRVMVFHRRR